MHGYWLLRKFFIEPPPYSDQLRVHSENCERKGGECMSLGGVRSPQRIFFLILDPLKKPLLVQRAFFGVFKIIMSISFPILPIVMVKVGTEEKVLVLPWSGLLHY